MPFCFRSIRSESFFISESIQFVLRDADNLTMKKKMHLTFNAPVTLTFALLSAFILLIDTTFLGGKLIPAVFTVPGKEDFNFYSGLDYFRLISHVFGHSDWNHFLGNFSFILLLGPLMEERYGSKMLLVMVVVTALVTGVINSCLIPRGLHGASGIVFMLIVLSSIITINKNEIPLSFIFIVALYLGREIINAGSNESISAIAHIAGGLCGSLFGFLVAPKSKKNADKTGAKSVRKRKSDSQETVLAPGKPQPDAGEDNTYVGTIDL